MAWGVLVISGLHWRTLHDEKPMLQNRDGGGFHPSITAPASTALLVYAPSRAGDGLTRGQLQRDWASRVKWPTSIPSSIRIHESAADQKEARLEPGVNGGRQCPFQPCNLPDDLHLSMFIRADGTYSPAVLSGPGYALLRLLEGFHHLPS